MNIQFDELRITNRLLATEALRRGWGVEVLDYRLGLVQYRRPQDHKALLFKSANGPFTRATDIVIADDKLYCSQLAERMGVQVPGTAVYDTDEAAIAFLDQCRELVVKPLDSAHGNGVSVGVHDEDGLMAAIAVAAKYSKVVLLQQFVTGSDLRILCIGGKAVAATRRHPATVTGDGAHTFAELIDIENQSEHRAANYKKARNFINISAAERYLGERLYTVPPKGVEAQVVGAVNIGMGGSAENIALASAGGAVHAAETLVRHIGLAICGVDFVVTADGMAYFIELNGNPSLGLHALPAIGEPVDVHVQYWNWIEANEGTVA